MSATFHGCKYKIPLPDHQWRMGVPVSGRQSHEREAAAKATGTSTNRPPRPAPHPVGAVGPGQLSCNDYGFVSEIIRLIPLHETVYPEVDWIASPPWSRRFGFQKSIQSTCLTLFSLVCPSMATKTKGHSTLTLDNTPSFRKVIHLLCCLPPV
ncbi:hypothetical protein B0H13DRAFT_2168961 [Mycena leptocephala]|nr:hypothetical protein B0H13DRAFT_2168961 [Mycena leptocephala]